MVIKIWLWKNIWNHELTSKIFITYKLKSQCLIEFTRIIIYLGKDLIPQIGEEEEETVL